MEYCCKEKHPPANCDLDRFLKELDLILKQAVKSHEKEINKLILDNKVDEYSKSIEFIIFKARKILQTIKD